MFHDSIVLVIVVVLIVVVLVVVFLPALYIHDIPSV